MFYAVHEVVMGGSKWAGHSVWLNNGFQEKHPCATLRFLKYCLFHVSKNTFSWFMREILGLNSEYIYEREKNIITARVASRHTKYRLCLVYYPSLLHRTVFLF